MDSSYDIHSWHQQALAYQTLLSDYQANMDYHQPLHSPQFGYASISGWTGLESFCVAAEQVADMSDSSNSYPVTPTSSTFTLTDGSSKSCSKTARRREQNRNAQRQYRMRKEKCIKEASAKVQHLGIELEKSHSVQEVLKQTISELRQQMEDLRRQNLALRQHYAPGAAPKTRSYG